METIGAPHSSAAFKHCSTVSRSVIVDLYSRMRPQPVQVKLQAWRGSSIMTKGNFSTPRSRFPAMYVLNFVVMPSGNLMDSSCFHSGTETLPGKSAWPRRRARRRACCGTSPAHKEERHSDRGDT